MIYDFRNKTTFVNRLGVCQFKIILVGLMSTIAKFQRMENEFLQNNRLALACFDDVFVLLEILSDHTSHLKNVFETVTDHNLKLDL